MKTEVINCRIEPGLKHSAESILKRLGMTTSDAITLFMHQLVLQEGLPFDVKVPKKGTQRAIKNALAGKNLKTYKTLDSLIREFE